MFGFDLAALIGILMRRYQVGGTIAFFILWLGLLIATNVAALSWIRGGVTILKRIVLALALPLALIAALMISGSPG